MSKILLDYAVDFTQVSGTTTASLAFLHNMGVIVSSSGAEPLVALTTPTGSDTVPAVITLSGIFQSPYILDGRFTTDDLQADENFAPLEIIAPASSDIVAGLWASFISGINGITATAVGSTIEVLATNGALSVDLADVWLRLSPQGTMPFIQLATGDDVINTNTVLLSELNSYKAGDVFSQRVVTDLPFDEVIEITLAADSTAEEAATLLSNAIQIASDIAIAGILAVPTGSVDTIWHSTLKVDGILSTTVTVSELVYTPAFISPPALESGIVEIVDPESIALLTGNKDVIAAFDGGLSKVYLILVNDISEVPALILDQECTFFTLYGSRDFLEADLLVAMAGWQGVKGLTYTVQADAKTAAAEVNTCAFYEDTTVPLDARAYFGIFSFANLLNANSWRNQQYIPVAAANGKPVTTLGLAESLFDDRVSFYLTDEEQGTRLAFFVAGGLSITDPYIDKEVQVVMQSEMLNYLAATQPMNIEVNRRQLEQIGNTILGGYTDAGLLDADGQNFVTITRSNEAFIVNGEMVTTNSEALWRVRIDALEGAVV